MDLIKSKYWLKPSKVTPRMKRSVSKWKGIDKFREKQAKNFLYRTELINKPTPEERVVGDYMWRKGVHFKFQKGLLKPFHRIVDFYIPFWRIIIEIDGGYHKAIVKKDTHKDNVFKNQRGMKTLRIKNEDVNNGSFMGILSKEIGHFVPELKL